MKQSTALLISAGATAFLLVLAGAVVTSVNNPQVASAQPQTAPAWVGDAAEQPAQRSSRGQSGEVQAQAPQPAPQADPVAPGADLTADQAAMVATRLARGAALLKTPELVDYGGVSAYEVALNAGTVYIGAQNGAILGVVPAQNPQAYQRRGERERSRVQPFAERSEHDEEHDEEDDDHE